MDSIARDQLKAWLTYFEDLGLSPFYTDRAALELPASSAAGRPRAPHTGSQAEVRNASPAPPSTPAPFATPLVAAPSLFDAVDRVEGDSLENISAFIGECQRCKLCKGRTKIVFGDGNPKAELVFVGEWPGHDEDVQGLPFVGRAGKLLTQMIEAMGLTRQDVYIANVVKCRPPENRLPEKDEIATCAPFLVRQLDAIRPKVIVCLGNCAAQSLIGTNKSISHFRGQWYDYRGARLIATYHPAYLLRNPAAKSDVWNDLKKVMAVLGLKPVKPRPRA
jgi:uracil-DNA glycosylase family 4